MTEHAAQIHESRLAVILYARQVWLHHDDATCSLQSTHVFEGKLPLIRIVYAISTRIETGHAHGWLDHPTTGHGRRPRLFRVQPSRRRDGNTAVFELSQIALVRVPSSNWRGVRQVGNASCPFQKRGTTWDIVPA
jgi:hypothetical protein